MAAEKRLRIERVLAGLRDGDEADDLIDEITEGERHFMARPARTHAGLIAHLDLLRHWIVEGCGFSTEANLVAADAVAAGLRDRAMGEQ